MIIQNGLVHDAVKKEPYIADIRIQDGKITKIGKKEDMMLDIIGATLEGGICGRMNVEEGGAR